MRLFLVLATLMLFSAPVQAAVAAPDIAGEAVATEVATEIAAGGVAPIETLPPEMLAEIISHLNRASNESVSYEGVSHKELCESFKKLYESYRSLSNLRRVSKAWRDVIDGQKAKNIVLKKRLDECPLPPSVSSEEGAQIQREQFWQRTSEDSNFLELIVFPALAVCAIGEVTTVVAVMMFGRRKGSF